MSYKQEYEKWLNSGVLTEEELAELKSIANDEKEIENRFYGPLEFGTAGLRGTMKMGLHQMNIYVIRWATQGFAEVICAEGEEAKRKGIAICMTAASTPISLPAPPQRSAPPTASTCASSRVCAPPPS